ncbi:hypothetical protein HMPREF3213_03716 [Heyndrickxia coagulans]|jgi:hypothetical protein|uniref:Uncharacterized protein n=1 Tax=Heyndrickxia coagulans TaxID=1398 RepID=A0A133KAY6_HEYCO|nr:hypothetical protein HMPREF3213_03716 [Heyndrickxia coagulans]
MAIPYESPLWRPFLLQVMQTEKAETLKKWCNKRIAFKQGEGGLVPGPPVPII